MSPDALWHAGEVPLSNNAFEESSSMMAWSVSQRHSHIATLFLRALVASLLGLASVAGWAAEEATYAPGAGIVTIPRVVVGNGTTVYSVTLAQGAGMTFSLTSANVVSGTGLIGNEAVYNPANGMLSIPRLVVSGAPNVKYAVLLTQLGSGYNFMLTSYGDATHSIVGTWVAEGQTIDTARVSFSSDGTFTYVENDLELPNGTERGTYTYNASSGQLNLLFTYDDNGPVDSGFGQGVGSTLSATVNISGNSADMIMSTLGGPFTFKLNRQ